MKKIKKKSTFKLSFAFLLIYPFFLYFSGPVFSESNPFDLYDSQISEKELDLDDLIKISAEAKKNMLSTKAKNFLLEKGDTPCQGLKTYLKELINSKIDTIEKLDIKVEAHTDGIKKGSSNRFKMVSVKADNFLLKGLRVKLFDFMITEPLLDLYTSRNKKRVTFVKADKINLKIVIMEDDLNTYVKEKVKTKGDRVRDPEITLNKDEVIFSGRASWWFFKTRFQISGHFEIVNKTFINFKFHTLKLSGSKAPGFIRKKLSEKLNPIADMSRFPVDFTLKKINIMDDRIEIIH